MSSVLEKIRSFCRSIGGRIEELEYSGYKVLSCILPMSKRISLTNYSGLVKLMSEDDGITVEFDIGRTGFKVSAREPKHSIFEKALEDWGFSTYILGDFNRFEVSYKLDGSEINISFWRD